MAFEKKTWTDRITEFPTRRTLTKSDGSTELVTVARAEGTVSQEGDAFSAENMNDLETRIGNEFGEINNSLTVIGNETDLYYATPNNANNIIPNLSQFREIRFEMITINEGYTFNSITLSVDKFKTLYSGDRILQLAAWLSDSVVLGARYINDTTIYVETNNAYWFLRVIGIK